MRNGSWSLLQFFARVAERVLMRTLTAWTFALITASFYPTACAAVTPDPSPDDGSGGAIGDGDGDGDGDGKTSGGNGSGSSSAGGTANQGVGGRILPMGGANPLLEECEDGATSPCSKHSPLYPAGLATCSDGSWSILECMKCEPNATVACADVEPTLPEGSVTCNSDGNGYTENTRTVCKACVPGETISCETAANSTVNRAGTATCSGDAGYDWSDCHLCEAGETEIDCIKIVGTSKVYSSGKAVCDATGDDWDDAGCQWCGDGAITGKETCDPGMSETTTCEAMGWEGDPTVVECLSGNECEWDRRTCSRCPGPECLGDNNCDSGVESCDGQECDGSCKFSCDYSKPTCDDVVCGNGSTCDFACAAGSADPGGCTNVVCDPNATCHLNCENQGGNCDGTVCKVGSNCDFNCGNTGASCTDVSCTGATCSFKCSNGGTCSTSERFTCQAGETCKFDCTNGGGCGGIQVTCAEGSTCDFICSNSSTDECVDAICEAGADCTVECSNQSCASVVIN